MDRRVRLGVAGDPDVGEGTSQLVEPLQQVERGGVLPRRRVLVAARDEDGGDAGREHPVADLAELGAVADHPRREVRHGGVAVLARAAR